MNLLVIARDSGRSLETYQEILDFLSSILDSDESSPVRPYKFDRGVNYRGFLTEMRIQSLGLSFWAHCRRLLRIFSEVMLMRVLFWTRAKVMSAFTAKGYVKDICSNTDYQKFDDMVRDCTAEQKQQVLAYLERRFQGGEI